MNGAVGGARIGNRRQRCECCNTFVRAVERGLARRMREEIGPERTAELRHQAELDEYPRVIDRFLLDNTEVADGA